MRLFSTLIISLFFNCCFSQNNVHETDIFDTTLVRHYNDADDTTYCLKKKGNPEDIWIIYFDKAHTHKADSTQFHKYGWDTYKNWYRNG